MHQTRLDMGNEMRSETPEVVPSGAPHILIIKMGSKMRGRAQTLLTGALCEKQITSEGSWQVLGGRGQRVWVGYGPELCLNTTVPRACACTDVCTLGIVHRGPLQALSMTTSAPHINWFCKIKLANSKMVNVRAV